MSSNPQAATNDLTPVSFSKFLAYFLWLGTTGFGGPIALAGYMQRDLVERRRWVTKEDYMEGLALAQLAPGPLEAGSYRLVFHPPSAFFRRVELEIAVEDPTRHLHVPLLVSPYSCASYRGS